MLPPRHQTHPLISTDSRVYNEKSTSKSLEILIPRRLNNKGIHTTDSPNPGEFPPDRAEEATRDDRVSRNCPPEKIQ